MLLGLQNLLSTSTSELSFTLDFWNLNFSSQVQCYLSLTSVLHVWLHLGLVPPYQSRELHSACSVTAGYSAFTLEHGQVLAHYPQTFKARMLLGNQNRGHQSVCQISLRIMAVGLSCGVGTLKKVKST